MTLSLSHALDRVAPSGIRHFAQLADETPGCVSLTMGEPGEDTPAALRQAASDELAADVTHYAPTCGYSFLREAISAYMRSRGEDYAPEQTIVTNGATEAVFCALATVLDEGDEVIIPQPAFILYEEAALLVRAEPVHLDTAPDAFQVRRESLEAACGPRTKAIVITSPNNPTGCVLDAESLDAVAEAAAARDLFVICDDVYEQLSFSDGFEGFAQRHPELADRTIVVNSFSKPYAMTGWRLGWLAASPEVTEALALVHQYAVCCEASFLQRAAAEALSSDVSAMRESYRARRDRTVQAVKAMGLPLAMPEGAFYAFPSIAELGVGSEEFCERAIREAGVAVVPGTCFGAEGYVRISYSVADDALDEGLRRLAGFVGRLRAEA